MLRLRHAIERASRRRWLGLLVVLCLTLLLSVLVFHTVDEHGGLEESALTCFAVVLVAAAVSVARRPPVPRAVPRPARLAPPGFAAVVTPVRTDWPPGSTPLRL